MEITVQHVVFIILSAVALVGAIGVVALRNLFRAALALVLSFVGVAGLYVLLEAELLAMVQILVYVGAISILIIFAIMLTRNLMDPEYKAANEQWLGGLLAAAALFGILVFILLQVSWPVQVTDMPPGAIEALGQGLVSPNFYLLPFEVASVLLLVALVGAVIIAREL
ncbi:MAG TPA: NADH-quinone oxidoreductase subunit J [Anaerolineae bacterium]|nr:NADH-quinone oxidoreductase subunit J [Anaerolineae bacterium]